MFVKATNPFTWEPLASWRLLDPAATAPHGYVTPHCSLPLSEFSTLTKLQSGYVISFSGLAKFHLAFDEKAITPFDIAKETIAPDLEHLLFDHIAPRILAHEGHLVVHGSAVEIAGKVAIFLGETGAGKSTLAASLHRAGHRLLGDDAVVISQKEGSMLAEPVYPSLRLYPDTISALLDEEAELSDMAHYSDKQRVALAELAGDPPPPLPLAAIFFLSGSPDASAVTARSPRPSQSCIKLLEQSFALDPKDARRAANRMTMASQLVEQIPTYEIDFAYGYDRLVEVHAAIEACIDRGRQRAE